MAEYIPDQIFAPEETIRQLADTGVTPFYLYDEAGLRENICQIHQQFSWKKGYQNYFPVRENPNPSILRILQEEGTGVSVCSLIELQLAAKCGFCGKQLMYQPQIRDAAAEQLALSLDAVWLLDSPLLMPDQAMSCVYIRYQPSVRRRLPNQINQIELSKGGIQKSELFPLISQLSQKGVQQIGLALLVSDYSVTPGFWENKVRILFPLLEEIRQKTGVRIWSCYLGESVGLEYRPSRQSINLQDEISRVQKHFFQLSEEAQPVIATGITERLLDPYGLLITKVLECRPISVCYLVLDVSVSQYMRAAVHKTYRHISVLGKKEIEARRVYYLIGVLPDDMDRLGNCRLLPETHPGDYCIIHCVGRGGRSMSSMYGTKRLCPEFLFQCDGSLRQISASRSPQEVLDFLTSL